MITQHLQCTELFDAEELVALSGASTSADILNELLDRFEERLRELCGFARRELGVAHFPMAGCDLAVVMSSPPAPPLEFDRPGPSGPRHIGFVYTIALDGEGGSGVRSDDDGDTSVRVRLFESRALDGREIAGPACAEVVVEDNSVVLFPGSRHVEFRGVDSEHSAVDRITIMGSIVGAPSLRSARRVNEQTQRELRDRYVPRLTDAGFEVRPTPPEVLRLLTAILSMRSTDRPIGQLSSEVLDISAYRHDLQRGIRGALERFAGVSLVSSGSAGMYLHREGHRIGAHHGAVDTEVVSAIIQVAQAPGVVWPYVLEREGRTHQVHLDAGQMLVLETASLSRSRPSPLEGSWVVTTVMHFRPLDWELTEELLVDRAVAEGRIKGVERRPVR